MSAAIQGIYVALFGRPADPAGLAYWAGVTKNGADLSEMLRVLPSLAEYTDQYAGKTPDQVITTVYQNLFGRAPDAEGLAFFKGQLASGAQSLATIAVNIMQGAQGDDKADVTAKVGAAELFTASLDTPGEIAAYNGAGAAALAKKFLDTVDKDKPATPEIVEKAAGAVVAGQDPTGGQTPNPGPGGPGAGTPVDTATSGYGTVSSVAQDGTNNLWAGGGNSAGNFEITTTSISKFELALKGYNRGTGDVDRADGAYKFNALDKAGFAFSVASLGGKTIEQLQEEGYTFHLKIDKDATAAADFVELQLGAYVAPNGGNTQDSGYDWAGTQTITDDEGNAFVTQNIQTPIWYGATERAPGVLAGGLYDVALEVRKGGSVVATETITLDVKYDSTSPVNGSVAASGTGKMFVGSGNLVTDFSIVNIDTNQNGAPDILLGLGGQVRTVGPNFVPDASGVMKVDPNVVPTLKWSVEALNGNSLADVLSKYDVKLMVDNDPSSGILNTVFTAQLDTTNFNLDWTFADTSDPARTITSDGGNSTVSQNVQALSWLLPTGGALFVGGAAKVAEGDYTVSLAVYEKGSTNLVGLNTVVFDVEALQ